MGLTYYGASTWGAKPLIIKAKNIVVFETGQNHSMSINECLEFSKPSYNFTSLKMTLLDMIDYFIVNRGQISVTDINLAKKSFVKTNNVLALDVKIKSPMGRMNYADSIIGCYLQNKGANKAGEIAFATRTMNWDNYTFLTDSPPDLVLPIPALDADCSSGVMLYQDSTKMLISLTTKGGISNVYDITKFDGSVKFNHSNLYEVGVKTNSLIYNGPNAALGGANYLTALAGKIAVSVQSNTSWFSGATSTTGRLERQVNGDGQVIEINNSFVSAFDVTTGEILWETPLDNRSLGQVVIENNIVYTQDMNGHLYALSLKDGKILWKFNGPYFKMNGGITPPTISSSGKIIWAVGYVAFGMGGMASKNGLVFEPNARLAIGNAKPVEFLSKRKFRSYDSSPKFSASPEINPTSIYFVVHKWNKDASECTMVETYQGKNTTYQLGVVSYRKETMLLGSDKLTGCQINFVNRDGYQFQYVTPDGITVVAWLSI